MYWEVSQILLYSCYISFNKLLYFAMKYNNLICSLCPGDNIAYCEVDLIHNKKLLLMSLRKNFRENIIKNLL